MKEDTDRLIDEQKKEGKKVVKSLERKKKI